MPEKTPLEYRRIEPNRKVFDDSRSTRIGLGILFGMAATILSLAVSALFVLTSGNLDAALLLFPYAVMLAGLTHSVEAPSWVMAIIQWPAYGALIGYWGAPWRGRLILILVVAHVCALVGAISVPHHF